MRKLIVIFFAILGIEIMSGADFTEQQLDSVLSVLDYEMTQIPRYREAKEQKIDSLRTSLQGKTDFEGRYKDLMSLYYEYRYYQNDSAAVYATRMIDEAAALNDVKKEMVGKIYLFEVYLSACYFYEASDLQDEIDPEVVDPQYRMEYYEMCDRLYQNIQFIVKRNAPLHNSYFKKRDDCYKNILEIARPGSYEHEFARIRIYRSENEGEEAVRFENCHKLMLDEFVLDGHQKAITYAGLGILNIDKKDYETAVYYYALSTIYDIRNNIRETTASTRLAELMLKFNNLDKAKRYIELALENALGYNSNRRILDASAVQSTIETARYYRASTHKAWLIGGVLVLMLVVFLLYGMYRKLRQRNRKLVEMQALISEKNNLLEESNRELVNLNGELEETNNIKDSYIMQSLRIKPDFLELVEKQLRKACGKIRTKENKLALDILSEIDTKTERNRMYASFDEAFFNLFPNFLEDFNSFFSEEDRFTLDKNGQLPTEVRIYALMRLGISKASEIANYLNLSVGTVYVYMSKVRTMSHLGNGEFEEAVKSISRPAAGGK